MSDWLQFGEIPPGPETPEHRRWVLRAAVGLLVVAVVFAALSLAGCKPTCREAQGYVELACLENPEGKLCAEARREFERRFPQGCEPAPTPTPTPEPPPTTTTTTTTTTLPPGPPSEPQTACTKKLEPGAVVSVKTKAYGQGLDTETRVRGDREFCWLIHGVNTDNCHLEGWSKRVECEMELLGGCPVFQFRTAANPTPKLCVDDHGAEMSCDHFGSVEFRDDPQTPTTGTTLATLQGFEGEPKVCGLTRDAFGPFAGFFVVAHGLGEVQACRPDRVVCGNFVAVNH